MGGGAPGRVVASFVGATLLALAVAGCSAPGGPDLGDTGAAPGSGRDAVATPVDGEQVWLVDRPITNNQAFDGTRVFLLEVSFPGGPTDDRRQVTLTAYTAADGRFRWATPVCEEASLLPVGDLASGVLVVNCATEGVWGVEAATGEVRWQSEVAPELDLNIQVAPAHVVLDDQDRVVVLDRRSGDEVLVSPGSADAVTSVVLAGDQLVLAGPDSVEAVGLDGAARWQVPEGGTWVLADDDRVVVAGEGEPIRIFDGEGREVQRWPALAPETYPLAVTGGHLLTYAVDVEESAVDLATGRTRWRLDPSWSGYPTVHVAADGLVRVERPEGGVEIRDVATQKRRASAPGTTLLVYGRRAVSVESVPGKAAFRVVPFR